jgi:uncharacterized membrane protein YfcA
MSDTRRLPNWDASAIQAGGLLALVIAVPLWVAASWAQGAGRSGLTLILTLGALFGFMFGAAAAAWTQRKGLPLAHGLVTSVGTYLLVQLVVSVYRLATGSSIDWFRILFFVTIAAGAGLIGGFLGMRMRQTGMLPSRERAGSDSAGPGEPQRGPQ